MNEDGGWGGWMQGFSLGRRVGGSCWNDDVVARVESNNEDTVSCERWRVFILNLDLDL